MSEPILASPGEVSKKHWVVVALAQQGRHACFLVRHEDEEEDPYVIHLKNHLNLNTSHTPKDIRWVIPTFSEDELVRVWFLLQRIEEQSQTSQNQLPFGFRFGNSIFTQDGQLRNEPEGGLTCASFVAVVFHSVALSLLQIETWKNVSEERRKEDRAQCARIIEHIRDQHPKHATQLETTLDDIIRIRPVEVAAASGMTPRPVAFSDVEAIGQRLEEALKPPPALIT